MKMDREINDIKEAKQNIPMDDVFCTEAAKVFYYKAEEKIRRMIWKDLLEVTT